MFVIKGTFNSKEVYFKKIENMILNGSEWDVRTCDTTIKGATLYKTYAEAEKIINELLDPKNFKVYPVCPKCHQDYYGYPSISRIDNKTKICDKCGLTEALTDFFEYEKKAIN